MTRDDFTWIQKEWARPALSSLHSRCIDRYLKAADLVQIGGKLTERLREAEIKGGTSLELLLPFWGRTCERYRNDLYSPQIDIFQNHDDVVLERWAQFIYYELFPSLIRDNEFVRNVLRATELLPCHSPSEASNALAFYISEMDLSN